MEKNEALGLSKCSLAVRRRLFSFSTILLSSSLKTIIIIIGISNFLACVCGSVKAFRYETVRMVKTEAAKAEQQIEK